HARVREPPTKRSVEPVFLGDGHGGADHPERHAVVVGPAVAERPVGRRGGGGVGVVGPGELEGHAPAGNGQVGGAVGEVAGRDVAGVDVGVGAGQEHGGAAAAAACLGADCCADGRLDGLVFFEEDVVVAVGVAGDEVGCGRVEHDVAAVGGDASPEAASVGLGARRVGADPLGPAGKAVVHVHVVGAVGIGAGEVGGVRIERDVASVTGDSRRICVAVALAAVRRHAVPFCRGGGAVAYEHVGKGVRIARHKVRGQ